MASKKDAFEFKDTLEERFVRATTEEDWDYVAKHPEIRIIVKSFLHQILIQRPNNVFEFAAEFAKNLKTKAQNEKKEARTEN